ncbi:MAG: glutamate mutase L [Paludibacterium sp.]|uniref:methylaspartate mutase accessory protein GlmL n=1 Tax=Paludibacterium sp. TaxID=1917523 RepID=UPI0025D36710|nr:methylaspartate mutase accessory protein GlmL [Paludibacterium sp.]MBV8047172.1 glutamate mutase L [Paludibacterium sp.]
MKTVSIDIGSTWTKGALFEVGDRDLQLIKRTVFPTTVQHLADGFYQVLNALLDDTHAIDRVRSGEITLNYSSSAKGGLAVAALGLVPSITLESARVAAYSAGAKITQVFAYRMNRSDIRALEANPPDILLFAGGTDGGHFDTIRHNAALLASSALDCSIVYAGNRAVQDEVTDLLGDKDLVVVENVLPALDQQNPDPAREAMRTIFLSRIVKGKGLDEIIAATGSEPVPTPYAVYEFTRHIQEHVPGWDDFILLDMGGATTDVYSSHDQCPPPGAVQRGLPEPLIKRTVEGDLGMRVSAEAVSETGDTLIAEHLAHDPAQIAAFHDYVAKVTAEPDYLPQDGQGKHFDTLLAGACAAYACERHAGRSTQVYTLDGTVDVLTGRDLTGVKKVIGSGGWLANSPDFDVSAWISERKVDGKGKTVLLPATVEYYRDAQYLFPLLANVARNYPEAAALTGVALLAQS